MMAHEMVHEPAPVMNDSIRVLLAKPTHDAHDRGVRYIAKKFRDDGLEVIFTTFLLPREVIRIAIDEDVDVIGISCSSHGHMPIFEELFTNLREHGVDDVLVIGGGVISGQDQQVLKAWGVSAVFGPGTSAGDAISHIRANVFRRSTVHQQSFQGT